MSNWTVRRTKWMQPLRVVQKLKKEQPERYAGHPKAKLLKRILELILNEIPRNPNSVEYQLGNTLGPAHRHWRRAKFLGRFRLFYRFSTAHRGSSTPGSTMKQRCARPTRGRTLLDLQQAIARGRSSQRFGRPIPENEIAPALSCASAILVLAEYWTAACVYAPGVLIFRAAARWKDSCPEPLAAPARQPVNPNDLSSRAICLTAELKLNRS